MDENSVEWLKNQMILQANAHMEQLFEDMTPLSAWFEWNMRIRKLTMRKVHLDTGVSQPTLTRLRGGQYIMPQPLRILATYFDYNPDKIDALAPRGKHHYKLTQTQINEIRALAEEDMSYATIGRIYGITRSMVHRIITGLSWTTVPSNSPDDHQPNP